MKKWTVTIICILLLSIVPENSFAEPKGFMDVHFIDVGQGDSILIETPNGKNILIDGGVPGAGKKVISYLKKQDIEEIDLLIATHPDYDHIGGLVKVMKEIDVKMLMDPGKFYLTHTYAKYASEIRKQGIPKRTVKAGHTIHIDPSLKIQVLNANEKGKSNNEASIVLKVTFDEMDFLFMSDVTIEQEKIMMEQFDVESEFIKVAHHGSDTSSSLDFLRKVNPDIAILTFSVDNDYGHPVERVVENLDRVDSLVYSTASYGDIVIRTNGEDYMIYSNRNPMDHLTRHAA